MEQVKQDLRRIISAAQSALAELEDRDNGAIAVSSRQLVWGEKVSTKFKAGVIWIEDQISLDADNLMACIAFETGTTFDPAERNKAGSSGTGLIQFMSFTAKNLGTTTSALAQMTAVRQLSYVYKYFCQFGRDFSGWSLEDTYMAILFPKAIGKSNDWPMPWKYGKIAYRQNAGLDLNKDRVITKGEASTGVRRMLKLGKQFRG